MNFLAHCALAADASETWSVDSHCRNGLLAGAIIADFCKGRVNTQWPRPLQGIRLHRRIDAVSNQHAAIRNSCQLYPKELRRYAPIFVDILADYHLSHRWQDYYESPFIPLRYSVIPPLRVKIICPNTATSSPRTCKTLTCWHVITTGRPSRAPLSLHYDA